MNIYHSYQDFSSNKKDVIVTLGTFDGVHLGHQEIIKNLASSAANIKGETVILTFFPHPRIVLQKGNGVRLLNTIDEKIELLKKTALDHLIIEPFTKEFSRLTAQDFARDILSKQLNTSKLIIGYDHRLGRNREGDFEQLKEYGQLYGFEVAEIPAKVIENITISSTKIRTALQDGEIEKANAYLGYHFMLTGEVVEGKALGRQYNYPTINIDIKESYKLIPKSGVYVVETTIDEKGYFGIMNIGTRPTVDGIHNSIEVHLLDFDANIYGETIQVGLLKRLRDEQKFDSVEALFRQIKNDENNARTLIKEGKVSFNTL